MTVNKISFITYNNSTTLTFSLTQQEDEYLKKYFLIRLYFLLFCLFVHSKLTFNPEDGSLIKRSLIKRLCATMAT